MVGPDDLVIAISEVDHIINVASSKTILQHIAGHLAAAAEEEDEGAAPDGELPAEDAAPDASPDQDHVIEFYSRDGERLHLVVGHQWRDLGFVSSGDRIDLGVLRHRIEAGLVYHAPAGETETETILAPAEPEWDEFLADCVTLLIGEGRPIPESAGEVPPSPGNWFHITFVHGGS